MTENSVDHGIDELLGGLEDDMDLIGFVEPVQPSFMPLADLSKMWGPTTSSLDELRNNPRRVATDILRLFLANRTPITLWGPVGARKTRSIESLAEEADENGTPYQVITIQPSTEDPTALHGLMYTSLDPDTGETVMRKSIPDVAQQVVRYWKERHGLTILFLDEMTTCLPAQQHALLGILTHGKYGDLDISPYITIAMAANPEDTVSTVNPLGEQVINRGGHLAWYGDPQLFLEDWGSGFGSPSRKPDEETFWYIKELLGQSMEKAFRGKWEIDTLVPYDLIEHTERSTTETSKMIKLINELFRDHPTFLRHFYLVEVVRALQGNEWAERMVVVCALEADRLSDTDIIRKVENLGITPTWTAEQLSQNVGKSLHMNGSKTLPSDKVAAIANGLLERCSAKPFDETAYLSLWVFAMTAPNEGVKMSMHGQLVGLLVRGLDASRTEGVDKTVIRPAFVDRETMTVLVAAIKSGSS